jgi:hypothetical protein
MGTHNLICAISKVPIRTDDEAYFILLKETFGRNHCYNNERFTPISFPILCSYDEETGLEFKCSDEEHNEVLKMMNAGMSKGKSELRSFSSIDSLNDLLDSREQFVYFDERHNQSYNDTKKEKAISYMVVHKSMYEMISKHEDKYDAGVIAREILAIENLQKDFSNLIDYIVEASNLLKKNPDLDGKVEFKLLKSWKKQFSELPLYSLEYWDINNTLEKNLKTNNLDDGQMSLLKSSLEMYFENIHDVSPEYKDIFLITPKFKYQRFTPLIHKLHCYGMEEFIKNVCLSNNKNYINSYLSMGRFDLAMDNLGRQYLPQIVNWEENYDHGLANMIGMKALSLGSIKSIDSIEDTLYQMADDKFSDQDEVDKWLNKKNSNFDGFTPIEYAQKANVSFGIDEIEKHLNTLDIVNKIKV